MVTDPDSRPPSSPPEPYRQFEHTGWERAAARYVDTFERATAPLAQALLDTLRVGTGTSLLDLACGAGLLAGQAMQRGANVVGADFARNMLARAQQRAPAAVFVQADAERLPFGTNAFDAVAISFGVHHFPFPSRALAETQRVLRPGGRLAFTIWAAPDINPLQKLVFDAIRATGGKAPQLPPPPGGGVTDAAACTKLLIGAGFPADGIRVETAEAPVPLRSAAALIGMLREGTVQTAAVIDAQGEARLRDIESHIDAAMARYRSGDSYVVPALALLVSAVKS